jgi:small GTP-binding protein
MLKLVIAGDGGVGKTSLVTKYTTGHFSQSTKMTIGMDLFNKQFTIPDIGNFYLQIWDFGGEERFRSLLSPYMIGAHGVLFLFSITDVSSLFNFTKWLEIIRKYDENIPILLVGTKCDLRSSRKIMMNEAIGFAQKHNCTGYLETSAANGLNVEKSFEMITREMWNDIIKKQKELINLSDDQKRYNSNNNGKR